MDLETVSDELYGLPPGEFTATRDERAKAARDAGDRELAEQIRRLRRPTLAAWAGNLLVREQPEEVQRLLQLGEALRQAHENLDGEQLRELSAQQHQLTFALARQAGQLTAQAGRRISEDVQREVQDSLHAVLADPGAAQQWAKGHLIKPLSAPAGLPSPASAGQPEPSPATGPGKRAAGKPADLDTARGRRRKKQERLEQARRQAAQADSELQQRQSELAEAEEEQSRAEEAQQQAEQHVADLSRQLKDAEHARQHARDATRQARDHAREADRAVREARRRARDTVAHARKLAGQAQHTT